MNIYFKGGAPDVFLRRVGGALSAIGMQVAYLPDDVDAWAESVDHDAYSIFQDRASTHVRAASLTRLLDTDRWLFNGMDDDSFLIQRMWGRVRRMGFLMHCSRAR